MLGNAQNFQVKTGATAEIRIEHGGLGTPATITVTTDPPLQGELTVNAHHRDGEAERVMIRPSREAGIHVFETSFDERGEWGLWLRYGSGIDLYGDYLVFNVSDRAVDRVHASTFEGVLAADVPAYVQPLGYAVFGLLLVLSLGTITWTLRWFARQKGDYSQAI